MSSSSRPLSKTSLAFSLAALVTLLPLGRPRLGRALGDRTLRT